jgi:hypothetical protein
MTSERSSSSEPTRERVRATIGQVGGYWRPLAGLARMQEELGELAELLTPRGADPEQLRSEHAAHSTPERSPSEHAARSTTERSPSEHVKHLAAELADLWIITTALSDQFLGRVAEPESHAGRRGDGVALSSRGGQALSCELLAALVTAAGPIARIVNYYDGPKTPRTFDGWISLSEAVANFHRALADVAHAHEADLAKAVDAKLDAIPRLDSGRFRAGAHNPSTAVCLEWFRALQTAGPELGEHARLWGSPEWSPDFASGAQPIVADLVIFAKAAAWERLDGYLVCGPPLTSMAQLDDWVGRLIVELSRRDPRGVMYGEVDATGHRDASVPIDRADRWLVFDGLRLDVAVFSPLCGASHPRRSPAGTPPGMRQTPGGTFALLQAHSVDGAPAQ